MAKKKVLILGASGFVGKNIYDRLSQREDLEVIGTYRTNRYKRFPSREAEALLLQVDLTNKNQVREIFYNVDVVIQAAATTSGIKDTIEQPWVQITDNAVMNPLIFETAHRNHVKQVIFFSSSILYPPQANRTLVEHEVNPDFFSKKHSGAIWTKFYLEKLSKFYSSLGKTKFTVIRPANLYGPYDRFDLERSHVLAAIITKVLRAQNGKITLWGNGEEKKDLLYISDLVDLVELCIKDHSSDFRVFNAGSGELISVKDLAQEIISLSGRDLKIEWDAQGPTALTSILLDNRHARVWLGWQKKVGLEKGLKNTIRWRLENSAKEENMVGGK